MQGRNKKKMRECPPKMQGRQKNCEMQQQKQINKNARRPKKCEGQRKTKQKQK